MDVKGKTASFKTIPDLRYYSRNRPIDSLVTKLCAILRPDVSRQLGLAGGNPYAATLPPVQGEKMLESKSPLQSTVVGATPQSSPKEW
jgi:hypothetical protein